MLKILFALFVLVQAPFSLSQQKATQYLQLKDKLDRPLDGYCLDVVGSGQYIRFDMPLTAHNCKGPQVYADEVVEYRTDKTLYFPAYKGCVTVMGLNDRALSGNSLMLKECGIEQPFLNAKNFQRFEFNEAGQIRLEGSQLCVAVGDESHTTYSKEHRWRNLFVTKCDLVQPKYSSWRLIPAGN